MIWGLCAAISIHEEVGGGYASLAAPASATASVSATTSASATATATTSATATATATTSASATSATSATASASTPSVRCEEWLTWIASLPASARDDAVEDRLGIATRQHGAADAVATTDKRQATLDASPGEHLVGYHASGVASIVRALLEAQVDRSDVVIDLGSGLGKVLLLARLLTGAVARGVELQPGLVARATQAASALDLDIAFVQADARTADIDEGTVFFLYLPFTGPALGAALARLHAVARSHAIVVCALGVDLDRDAPWLARRNVDSFWLSVYDSQVPGVTARAARRDAPLDSARFASLVSAIVDER